MQHWLLAVLALTLFPAVACGPIRSQVNGGLSPGDPRPSLSPAAPDLVQTGLPPVPAPPAPSGSYEIGVLLANGTRINSDYAAGVRLASVELHWASWEPAPGQFSQTYRNRSVRLVDQYRRRGFRVAVSVGLQYAPDWVLGLRNGTLQSQTRTSSSTPNFFFSQDVRDAVVPYMRDVVRAIGAVSYYRVGLSPTGETLYPESPHGEWWAFDTSAQNLAPGRPLSVLPPPMPGWVPGDATYRGQRVRVDDVISWYNWYLNASVDAHAWQISVFRQAGYRGDLQLVMPGSGANPWVYAHRIAAGLSDQPYDAFRTMNSGAVWNLFLERLPDRSRLVVDISSVYDTSGVPRGNACRTTDVNVDYRTDPEVSDWSSVRWLAYLARINELPVIGENPGSNSAADMRQVFRLMVSCGLRGLQWAWNYQLYDQRHASIADLAANVKAL